MSNPDPPRSRLTLPAVGAFIALLAAGLGLRLAGIGTEGLWLDEIYSATYANLSLLQTACGGHALRCPSSFVLHAAHGLEQPWARRCVAAAEFGAVVDGDPSWRSFSPPCVASVWLRG